MALSWITPKTNWKSSTQFTYTDYNRIRNNLLFINEKLNEMFPEYAEELDLGDEKTGYSDVYHASEFNAFEDALESFERVGMTANVGNRGVYKANGIFIGYKELNRIESCCLSWKNFEPPATSAEVSPDRISFNVGQTQQLTVVPTPSCATYTVTWSSSNVNAATVDSNGLVSAVADGTFTITARIRSGLKTFVVKIDGRIASGSFFYYNNQKYFFDLVYHGDGVNAVKNGAQLLLPKYRTNALVGKWGSGRSVPEIWNDNGANYRDSVTTFVSANCSLQMKKALLNFSSTVLEASVNRSEQGYGIAYTSSSSPYTDSWGYKSIAYLPSTRVYNLDPPEDSDPQPNILSLNENYRDCTEDDINGVPLITGTDKGQLIMVRMKNGDNFTMARLLGKQVFSAGYDEVLPLRPLFAVNDIYVYPTPTEDGAYSIDWGKGAKSIKLSDMPYGTVIRDDSGSGRTG